MNSIRLSFKKEEFSFEVDYYNQILINHQPTFFKWYAGLKYQSNFKLDEYFDNKYDASLFIENQKMSKSNLLFLDLSSYEKIFEHLTFKKNSLLFQNQMTKLEKVFTENEQEEFTDHLREKLLVDQKFKLIDKEPDLDKIVSLYFQMYLEDEQPLKFNNIVEVIQDYSANNPEITIIILLDTNLRNFLIDELLTSKKIFIFDLNPAINNHSNNFLNISNDIENFQYSDLVDKITFNWPESLEEEKLKKLMIKNFKDIQINNSNHLFTNDEICLYIIIQKIFNKTVTKNFNWKHSDSPVSAFIQDNMV